MTENLRLVFSDNYVGKYDSSNNTITATTTQITPENSDVTATWLPGNTTETASTKTIWGNYTTEADINTTRSIRDNTFASDGDNISQNTGTYYDWYAVTAGTGTYSVHSGQSATNSICPKGFTLPGIRDENQPGWMELITKITGYHYGGVAGRSDVDVTDEVATIARFPISVAFSGVYNGQTSSFGGKDYYLHLWARRAWSVNDATGYQNAYTLDIRKKTNDYNAMYNTTSANKKIDGAAVRCIAK